GHGGQVEDLDGDEDDGFDETILPLDHEQSGQIIDDEMHDIMVRPLQPGVVKEYNILSDGGNTLMTAGMSYLRGDLNGIKTSIMSFGKKVVSGNKIAEQNRVNKLSHADVIMFSGCKDSQTSADANEAGQNTGAILRRNQYQTYQQLLNSIREILAGKYSQKPQLSTSHPMDMNLLFMM
ncbi:27463_t:CDS:2, partial [Racocetra persica]